MIDYICKCQKIGCPFKAHSFFDDLIKQVSEDHMMQTGHIVEITESKYEPEFHHF